MSFHEQPDEKTNVHEVHNNDNDKMQNWIAEFGQKREWT